MLRGLSIRRKLALYAVSCSTVGAVVAAAVVVIYVGHLRDAVPSHLSARTSSLVAAVEAAEGDSTRLETILRSAVEDRRVYRATVINGDGSSVVSVPSSPPFARPLALGYDANALRLVVESTSGGRVAIWYNEAALYDELNNGLVIVGVTLVSGLVAALLFASLVGRWVAQPISELAALARSIPESGDFTVERVSTGRDEVGQLGAAFGEMLAKVERRERALEEARRAAELAANEARQMAAQAQATADALAGETEAREHAQRQLEQAQKMEALGRLAGGIAHDFNNLLFVIGTYADDLVKRLDGEDHESIEQIQEAVRRATKLTQQLLSFSRQPRGDPIDVDVGQMLVGMQRLLERLIGEDIALSVEGATTRMVVRAPEGALESAVMNLVVNARDALPSGGRIKISMRPAPAPAIIPEPAGSGADRWMELTVEDDGLGMDEHTRRHAFEPFFTTKPAGEGTGLGLTLVYALCRQLGGQVTVHSEIDKGTRFELLLPLGGADSGFSVDIPSMTPLPSEEGRVLVAEDDPQVRRLVVRVLRRAGFDVDAVEDGQAAFERLEIGPPVDLVVSDVVMPRMGGLDLAQALRRAKIEVPMLFISGYPANPGQSSAPFPPELPMLRKPFTAQALRQIVRRMLGRAPRTPPPVSE